MENHDAQFEIQKQHSQRQEKFVYYLIALCVAAIGFSVTQTANQKLNCLHTVLGFSFLFWVFSIFCGFQFIKILLLVSDANNKYFDTIAGRIDGINPSQTVDKAAATVLREKANNYSIDSQWYFNWQQYSFYAGLILFVVWHVIQMTKN